MRPASDYFSLPLAELQTPAVSARSDFTAFTDKTCQALIRRYGTGLELWERFQEFMQQQIAKGADGDYYFECFSALERAWGMAISSQ